MQLTQEVPRYPPKMTKSKQAALFPEVHQAVSIYATKRRIRIYEALNELVKIGLAKVISDGELSEDELK